MARHPRCRWRQAEKGAGPSTAWRAGETTSSTRFWAGSWPLITTLSTTSRLRPPTSTGPSTSCAFSWSYRRSWGKCRSLSGISELLSNTWSSSSGFWPSSMRIFSQSPPTCRHQRPTTTWSSRGLFFKGDTEAFFFFPFSKHHPPTQHLWARVGKKLNTPLFFIPSSACF